MNTSIIAYVKMLRAGWYFDRQTVLYWPDKLHWMDYFGFRGNRN